MDGVAVGEVEVPALVVAEPVDGPRESPGSSVEVRHPSTVIANSRSTIGRRTKFLRRCAIAGERNTSTPERGWAAPKRVHKWPIQYHYMPGERLRQPKQGVAPHLVRLAVFRGN